ncbi:MAG: transposase [Candidatus Saganbacteria bacterium]|nr:transposase [Candidatus Saganbacteria bacterium]
MSNHIKYKKRIHLKDFEYKGYYRYFVTICISDKKTIFTNKSVVANVVKFLNDLSRNFNFLVWAYCFMPDHLHLLLEGTSDDSNLKKFISMFKQKTGFWYQQKFGIRLWQINYYEHVLRKEEDIKEVASYIFANPVRKGLVENYKDYPFLGSFEFDVKLQP